MPKETQQIHTTSVTFGTVPIHRWGGVGGTRRHSEAVAPKWPGEILQTHPNDKRKIKGNGSKSRSGPKQEGRHVCKLATISAQVSSMVKARCGVKHTAQRGRQVSGPACPSAPLNWSPVRHKARPTTTNLQSRQTYLPWMPSNDSEDKSSQPEFFNNLKRIHKTISFEYYA